MPMKTKTAKSVSLQSTETALSREKDEKGGKRPREGKKKKLIIKEFC